MTSMLLRVKMDEFWPAHRGVVWQSCRAMSLHSILCEEELSSWFYCKLKQQEKTEHVAE